MQESTITSAVTLRILMGKQRYSWHSPPRVNVTVQVIQKKAFSREWNQHHAEWCTFESSMWTHENI